jgi:hypothetical protein
MDKRLPQTIDEMKTCLGKMFTEQSTEQVNQFKARTDDVFVVTYPKSGTTWMQQIVHGLTTQGSMDFGEIGEVMPWIEVCGDLGQDIEQPQQQGIRCYKTHLDYERVPKNARYIYVVRDPKDVVPSFYHFFEGFLFAPNSISIEQFFFEFLTSGSKSGKYWDHLRSWWSQRENPNVLFFTFEHLKQDLSGCVHQVAKFLDIQLTPAAMEKVIHQSSFAFMNEHNSHFDDHFLLDKRREVCNLPIDVTTSKVRSGKSGGNKGLSPKVIAKLEQLWADEIEAKIGFEDYQALRQQIDNIVLSR